LVSFRTEKVLKVWQKTVFDHPDSPALWKAYLAFFQSNFSSFTMSALRTLYGQAVKILLKSKALYKIGTVLSKDIEVLVPERERERERERKRKRKRKRKRSGRM
jgi:hypothetical protein